jgi:hypothetical protein
MYSQLFPSPSTAATRSLRSGNWSDPVMWSTGIIPGQGEEVVIDSGHVVVYDLVSGAELRLVHIRGTLEFSRTLDTQMDVGMIIISTEADVDVNVDCSSNHAGPAWVGVPPPALEVGTWDNPIPAGVTARIRLVYFSDMSSDCAPGIMCYSGRMDLHGKPMDKTWVKLAETAPGGASSIVLAEPVDWQVGDRILVTRASKPPGDIRALGSYRTNEYVETEERFVTSVAGNVVTLDTPLEHLHPVTGEFAPEVADLSRNVIIESKDPDGIRGHTMYHHESRGSISYAEFAHLGKEGALGRYPIHYHLIGSTMRGSSVIGASIWDSHNRFVTIHGTNFLVIRDCIGYQSVGHGFFMEDATEVFNFLDHNLSVHAYEAEPLPGQVLQYDLNDGSGFWWANGWNAFVDNVAVECDQYGFKFDIQPEIYRSILQPDGTIQSDVQVEGLPFILFSGNEAHGVLYYGYKGNGNATETDPFIIKDMKVWQSHYGYSADINNFIMTDIEAWTLSYGWHTRAPKNGRVTNFTARNIFGLTVSFQDTPEGLITFENVLLDTVGEHPFRIMGKEPRSESCDIHVRDYEFLNVANGLSGAGSHPDAMPEPDLTLYLHDWFGPDQDAKVIPVVQTRDDSLDYQLLTPIFASDVKVAQTSEPFPVSPIVLVDYMPPVTAITYPANEQVFASSTTEVTVLGSCIDASVITSVEVNGVPATPLADNYSRWEATLQDLQPGSTVIVASAIDEFGNAEMNPHTIVIGIGSFPVSISEPAPLLARENQLFQNSPNPFNSGTTIRYTLSSSTPVTIAVYDLLGREVVRMAGLPSSPGQHVFRWDGRDLDGLPLSSGVYLYALTTGDHILSRKMILLR